MSGSPERLSLYHFGGCPYCVRVRSAIDRLGLDVELHDILADRDRLAELVDATGRRTVPCVRIESPSGDLHWMHESADIVRWLEARYGAAA